MSARLLRVLAGALLLSCWVQAAGHAAPTARLTGVATKTEVAGTTVVIETTEPVAYVAAQPDPLTLLVDLRSVSPGDVRPDKASGAVADVAVESVLAEDGTEVARVRLLLARPATPNISSRLNSVFVRFDNAGAEPPASGGPVSTGAQAAAAGKPETAEDVVPSKDAALTKIDAVTGPEGTRVTFSGPGTWKAGTVAPARDLPPRLVVDFPELRSTLPAVTPIGKGPVDRVRVAVNRRDPLVTRAVIDLKYPVTHRVEPAEGGIAIVFEEKTSPSAAPAPEAAAAPAPPAARAGSKAAAVRSTAQPVPAEKKPEAKAEPVPVVVAPAKPAEPKAAAEVNVNRPAAAPALQEPKPAEPKPAEPKVLGQKPAPAVALDPDKQERQYTGHLVSFDFFQADLRSVLRTFSEISGLNVVIDPSIPAGTVDVSLKEVPWDQALEVILRSHQLGYVLENNVVRIAPMKALAQEETERQKLLEAQAMSGQLKVLTRTLSYAKADDLAKLLKDTRVISSRGTAIVDTRTNTLIINDLPDALAQSESLISSLDRAEPQVEIEARIVQTSKLAARSIGVQWGLNGRMANALANPTGLRFPAQASVSGRTTGMQGNPGAGDTAKQPSAVNLGATNATSALGISMGTLTGSFNLDVALSAMESKGQGKILSQPRVMMQNNFEAEMTQGVQIPLQTSANNTVSVTFKDATLTLKVKPQITAANTVMMNISLENAAPDYSRSVNGIPPIDTQRAITQVLINDGETMVIGGIMKSEESSSKDGVPGIAKIPLLGWLFRRDSMSSDQRELLIFITPRIQR